MTSNLKTQKFYFVFRTNAAAAAALTFLLTALFFVHVLLPCFGQCLSVLRHIFADGPVSASLNICIASYLSHANVFECQTYSHFIHFGAFTFYLAAIHSG